MLLAVMGNGLISAGLIATKRAHMELEKLKEDGKELHYTKLPAWWIGFLGTVAGEVGNFLAYGPSRVPPQ